MEDEQQGCFDPVILGPVVGSGCALIVVMMIILGVFLLSLSVL